MVDNDSQDRSSGVVQWFSIPKGYGFIKPHDGGEDLFVHQSAINSDGFRSLFPGDEVEFSVIFEGDKSKAINVTAPNNSSVQRRSSNVGFGSRRVGSGGCYTCGDSGHLARDCVRGKGGCFNCGVVGHIARDCVGSNGNKGCYNCGDTRHLARDCDGNARNIRNEGVCFNCGGAGHLAKDCGNVGDGGVARSACFRCGDIGHRARECVKEILDSFGGGNCFKCGEAGHFARECSRPNSDGPRVGRRGCFHCGEPGHFARECPGAAMA